MIPAAIDVEPCAVLRAFRHGRDDSERIAYLHLGDNLTTVLIADGDPILFLKYVGSGGREMDQAVAKHLELDLTEAMRVRASVTISATLDSQSDIHRSVIKAIRPDLESLASELELSIANRTTDSAPLLIQQAAMQSNEQAKQQTALRQLDRLLDDENELRGLLQQVANLAYAAGFKMDRIQPLATIVRETYRVIPYQVTISGNFRRIAQYLHGLESQPTLFTVERLQLKSESEQASETLKADLTFSVFVKRASFVAFSEKSDSPTQTQADDSRTHL